MSLTLMSLTLMSLTLMSLTLMKINLTQSHRERPQPQLGSRIAAASLASAAMRVASSSRPANRC